MCFQYVSDAFASLDFYCCFPPPVYHFCKIRTRISISVFQASHQTDPRDLFRSTQVSACWRDWSPMPWRPPLWPSTCTSSTSTSAAGARGTTGPRWTARTAWQCKPSSKELTRHGFHLRVHTAARQMQCWNSAGLRLEARNFSVLNSQQDLTSYVLIQKC